MSNLSAKIERHPNNINIDCEHGTEWRTSKRVSGFEWVQCSICANNWEAVKALALVKIVDELRYGLVK